MRIRFLGQLVTGHWFYLSLALILLSQRVIGAPVEDWLDETSQRDGCYYQFQHYSEGEQIKTNEPCLNCTCHNQILMCYLRVCPFIRPLGKNCVIERREGQCCPTVVCPEVPVLLLPGSVHEESTDLAPTTGTAITTSHYGCEIDGETYSDGMQVPRDPKRPCELCYCIRNYTVCVVQECSLNVDGCSPVYQEGVCCPIRYDCEPDASLGALQTTTVQLMKNSNKCLTNGTIYEDGALIDSLDPCEHCYCMKGEIVCALEQCMTPGSDDERCVAQPPGPNACCPAEFKCDTEKLDTKKKLEKFDTSESIKVLANRIGAVDSDSSSTLPDCLVDNDVFKHGEAIPSKDQCTTCKCFGGSVLCSVEVCGPSLDHFENCKKIEDDENVCCPKYECGTSVKTASNEVLSYEELVRKKLENSDNESDDPLCLVDGQVYGNFDKVPNSNDCEICYCNFGEVVCSRRICPTLPIEFSNCQVVAPIDGKCCADEYICSETVPETSVKPEVIPEVTTEAEVVAATTTIAGSDVEVETTTSGQEVEVLEGAEETEAETEAPIATEAPEIDDTTTAQSEEEVEDIEFETESPETGVVEDEEDVEVVEEDIVEEVTTEVSELMEEVEEEIVAEVATEVDVSEADDQEGTTQEPEPEMAALSQGANTEAGSELEETTTETGSEVVAEFEDEETTTETAGNDAEEATTEPTQTGSSNEESLTDVSQTGNESEETTTETAQTGNEIEDVQEEFTTETVEPGNNYEEDFNEPGSEAEETTTEAAHTGNGVEDMTETAEEGGQENIGSEIEQTTTETGNEITTEEVMTETTTEDVTEEVAVEESFTEIDFESSEDEVNTDDPTTETSEDETTAGNGIGVEDGVQEVFTEASAVEGNEQETTTEEIEIFLTDATTGEEISETTTEFTEVVEEEVVEEVEIVEEVVDEVVTTEAGTEVEATTLVEEVIEVTDVIEEVLPDVITTEQPQETTETEAETTTSGAEEETETTQTEGPLPVSTVSESETTSNPVPETTEQPVETEPPEQPETTAQPEEPASTDAPTTTATVADVTTTTEAFLTCIDNGITYNDGQDVPNNDPCKLCTCDQGIIICATKQCPAPPSTALCQALQIQPGKCCPDYACSAESSVVSNRVSQQEEEVGQTQPEQPNLEPEADHETEDAIVKGTASSHVMTDGDLVSHENNAVAQVDAQGNEVDDESKPTQDNTVGDVPVQEDPVNDALVQEDSVGEVPVHEVSADDVPVQEDTVGQVTDQENTVNDDQVQENDHNPNKVDNDYVEEMGEDEQYDELLLSPERLAMGSCVYNGKTYMSAQQIPRNNSCDFCFCFRSDIICLQQSCPPPIPGCQEEPIEGFCCPRYECPINSEFGGSIEPEVTRIEPEEFEVPNRTSMSELRGEVKGCEVQGSFYEQGTIVDKASNPCLLCRCGFSEKLECEPQPCEPKFMIDRMLKFHRRK